jgi:sortase B
MNNRANKIRRKTIKMLNVVIDFVILLIIISMVAFAGYSIWDSNQVYKGADKSQYEIYKPSVEDEGKSFEELQRINPEVIAWLTVYGTNIDYPVTQGEDNMKYVNTNAEGLYSLSGAIFLDSRNNSSFKDFNSIFYGHHMEKETMFGEIEKFSQKDMFDSRRFGNLHFDGKDYGIEFFAFVHADAYDFQIFAPNVEGDEKQEEYLEDLISKAVHTRDIGVTIKDKIVLLSTCSSNSTNGRDILVGRLTDEVFEDTFLTDSEVEVSRPLSVDANYATQREVQTAVLGAVLAAFVIIVIAYYVAGGKRSKRYRWKE